MSVIIPDDVLSATPMSDAEMKQEIAIMLLEER